MHFAKIFVFSLLCILGNAVGSSAIAQHDFGLAINTDILPPKIIHEPISKPITDEETVTLTADVTDDSGVKDVTLFYRSGGVGEFRPLPMVLTNGNTYESTIETEVLSPPELEYYIQAEDAAGNTVFRAGKFFPLKITVVRTDESGGTAHSESTNLLIESTAEKKSYWPWILGALAVGAVAALAGGGGGDSNDSSSSTGESPTTGSITIIAPAPDTRR